MPNQFLVRNPALSEFVFDLLYNITPEQKKKLSRPFVSLLKSDIKAKNFAEYSTLDEKVRLFHELGIDNALVFFQDKINSVTKLKEILKKYEENMQAGAVKEITHLKAFVSSDKTVSWLLGYMADSIHSKSYFLNMEYSRIGFHIKDWNAQIQTKGSVELKDAIDNGDLLVKTMLNTMYSVDYSEGFLGVRENEVKVLMYLYLYRHTYIERERLMGYFGVGFKGNRKVITSVKRLFDAGHIKKHPDFSIAKYTISSSGIKIINEFVQRILTQNNF